MQKRQFPKQVFNNAMLISRNLKPNMRQFLQQYSIKNIPWIYQSIQIIYRNLDDQTIDPEIKVNSLLGVQLMIETSQFILIGFIQAFIFPIIVRGAHTDTSLPDNLRGRTLFNKTGKKQDTLDNFGNIYVLLCTEIIKVLSIIKPKSLYYNQQVEDKSNFTLAQQSLASTITHPISSFRYFQQDPQILKRLFIKSIKSLTTQLVQQYKIFLGQKFSQQIKNGFNDQVLDIRQLIQTGDCYFIQQCLTITWEIFLKGKTCNVVRLAINFVHRVVVSGHFIVAVQMLEFNQDIKLVVKEVIKIQSSTNALDRGQKFFPNKKGSPQEHKLLYIQFLKDLQLWSNVFTKDSINDPKKPSRIQRYYQKLSKEYRYEFPSNAFLVEQIQQVEKNYHKNYYLNEKIKKQNEEEQYEIASNADSILINKINGNRKSEIKNSQYLIIDQDIQLTDQKLKQLTQTKIKNIQQLINQLSKSQRLLPTTIKKYKEEYKQLQKLLDENSIRNSSLSRFSQYQQHHQKICQIFQQYKINKINYLQFCKKIQKKYQKSGISSKGCPPNGSAQSGKNIYESDQESNFMKGKKLTSHKQVIHIEGQQSKDYKSKSEIPINNQPSQKPSKATKKQQILPPNKIQFDRSQLTESKLANQNNEVLTNPHFILSEGRKKNYQSRDSDHNLSFYLDEEVQFREQQEKKKYYRLFNNNDQLPEQSRVQKYEPITNSFHHQPISSNKSLKSPIKIQEGMSQIANSAQINKQTFNNDQLIEGPMLNPLNNSYHDYTEMQQKENIRNRTFKEVINNDRLMIKTNKKQNFYWLENQSSSLIRPVAGSLPKPKNTSRVNVPELLEQCNKKHEMEIKLLERSKQVKIKELETKVNMIEEQLKAKSIQLKQFKQTSEGDPYKSRTINKYNIVDDQTFLLKKLNQVNQQNQNKRKMVESVKQSKILAVGQLINTKVYAKYFEKISEERQKKIHMKNKQLIYKDTQLEIGYTSQLNAEEYKITCYITPEKNMVINSIQITKDQNLQIIHNIKPKMEIVGKKQQRVVFTINILAVPYMIPDVILNYRLQNTDRITKFTLPCAFHKFVIIHPESQQKLLGQYQTKDIIRGEEIPYSKKIIKNIDILQDYLPHIEKINKGRVNQIGEVCFGGRAVFGRKDGFYIKICVKPNQFLYIQSIQCKNMENRKIVQFYIASLNHFLMKNIVWS